MPCWGCSSVYQQYKRWTFTDGSNWYKLKNFKAVLLFHCEDFPNSSKQKGVTKDDSCTIKLNNYFYNYLTFLSESYETFQEFKMGNIDNFL